MHWFTLLVLALLALTTVLRVVLSLRQIAAMRSARARVPKPFDESISLADHRKACDYTAARSRLAVPDHLLDAALFLGWTLFGGLALLDRFWTGLGLHPLITGSAVIISATLIAAAINLPLSIYSTFGIEARFGFNKTTVGLYVADLVKGLLVSLALGTPLLIVILWLMGSAGSLWWLYAWAVWVAFSLLMTWAYPAFIAPLFNRFSPLENESLRSRIEALLERCGFQSNGIFVMDGSTRSTHGNAYFTGVGTNKRIVFFDTLIEALKPDEIEAVLAHELGHFSLRHIRKRLVLSFAVALLAMAALGYLREQPWFFSALGADSGTDHIALMLFFLITPLFTYFLTPIGARLSRQHEFEADEYAARHCHPRDLVTGLVTLYRDNATALSPTLCIRVSMTRIRRVLSALPG